MEMAETIAGINRILSGLARCQMEFIPLQDIIVQDWNGAELRLAQLHAGRTLAPRVVSTANGSGAFGLPICVDDVFLGLAVLRNGPTSTSESVADLIDLADLLKSLIENKLTERRRAEGLRLLQERLEVQENQGSVVPLRITRLEQVRRLYRDLESSETRDVTERPMNSPLLIDIADETDAHRMALEIHERSGRWAFLSLENLAVGTLDSIEALKSLGGITLFIRDLPSLTDHEQLCLTEYLAIQPDADMPQIIAVCAQGSDRIQPHLLKFFSRCCPRGNDSSSIREQADAIIRTAIAPVDQSELSSRGRLIPFDLRLLDPDHAPMH